MPWIPVTLRLPPEDGMQLDRFERRPHAGARVKIAVLHLPHIANFDDFDPLSQEPHVELVLVKPGDRVSFIPFSEFGIAAR